MVILNLKCRGTVETLFFIQKCVQFLLGKCDSIDLTHHTFGIKRFYWNMTKRTSVGLFVVFCALRGQKELRPTCCR